MKRPKLKDESLKIDMNFEDALRVLVKAKPIPKPKRQTRSRCLNLDNAQEDRMRLRMFGIAVLWASSLAGAALWAQAEPPQIQSVSPEAVRFVKAGDPAGPVMTGADIGFQPIAVARGALMDRSKVHGRWMVRLNGEWFEASPIQPVQ